jgi:phage shock protein PspC (stress-responsive transcriptional regulator)
MKKLYRSSTNKKIAGVCGGLAEYLGVNATIIRIIFIILLLPGGLPGLIPYLILWAVVPLKPTDVAGATTSPK